MPTRGEHSQEDSGLRALPADRVTANTPPHLTSWYGGVTVAVSAVDLCDLRSVIEVIHETRLHLARTVHSHYEAAGLEPFQPVTVGHTEAHLGMLLESGPQGLLVLDGVHRAVAAAERGTRRVRATIICPHVAKPWVAPGRPLADVRTSSEELEPKYTERGITLFRPAASWVNSWINALSS